MPPILLNYGMILQSPDDLVQGVLLLSQLRFRLTGRHPLILKLLHITLARTNREEQNMHMAEITPNRPGAKQMDPEVEQVILARLETFDEDVKMAVPARQALDSIRKNLKHLAIR